MLGDGCRKILGKELLNLSVIILQRVHLHAAYSSAIGQIINQF